MSWFPPWVACASGWGSSREEDIPGETLRVQVPLMRTRPALQALALRVIIPPWTGPRPHPPPPSTILRTVICPALTHFWMLHLLRIPPIHSPNLYKARLNRRCPCSNRPLPATPGICTPHLCSASFLNSMLLYNITWRFRIRKEAFPFCNRPLQLVAQLNQCPQPLHSYCIPSSIPKARGRHVRSGLRTTSRLFFKHLLRRYPCPRRRGLPKSNHPMH